MRVFKLVWKVIHVFGSIKTPEWFTMNVGKKKKKRWCFHTEFCVHLLKRLIESWNSDSAPNWTEPNRSQSINSWGREQKTNQQFSSKIGKSGKTNQMYKISAV